MKVINPEKQALLKRSLLSFAIIKKVKIKDAILTKMMILITIKTISMVNNKK